MKNGMRNELLEIGNEVASLWGGSCYDVEIKADEKKVVFVCIEHGEHFVTELSFEDIKKEYGCDVAKELGGK